MRKYQKIFYFKIEEFNEVRQKLLEEINEFNEKFENISQNKKKFEEKLKDSKFKNCSFKKKLNRAQEEREDVRLRNLICIRIFYLGEQANQGVY